YAVTKDYTYSCVTPQGRIGYDEAFLKLTADSEASDLSAKSSIDFRVDEMLSMPPGEVKNHHVKIPLATIAKRSSASGKTDLVFKDDNKNFAGHINILKGDAAVNAIVDYRYLNIVIIFDDIRFECRLK
ncbi:MAG: hypothetical protein K2Q18_03035, partial [Bdellovibrionales bacterium]|nr:hypothetical protein [Bdellovibrionales bacterium]